MKLLFDFTAGTSTGSIIAAGLAMPLKADVTQTVDCSTGLCKPKFFADDLIKIYSEKGHIIFKRYAMSGLNVFLWLLLFLISFTALFYYLGTRKYDSKEVKEQLKEMQEIVKAANAKAKGKDVAEKEMTQIRSQNILKSLNRTLTNKPETKVPLLQAYKDGHDAEEAGCAQKFAGGMKSCWKSTTKLCGREGDSDSEDEKDTTKKAEVNRLKSAFRSAFQNAEADADGDITAQLVKQ